MQRMRHLCDIVRERSIPAVWLRESDGAGGPGRGAGMIAECGVQSAEWGIRIRVLRRGGRGVRSPVDALRRAGRVRVARKPDHTSFGDGFPCGLLKHERSPASTVGMLCGSNRRSQLCPETTQSEIKGTNDAGWRVLLAGRRTTHETSDAGDRALRTCLR